MIRGKLAEGSLPQNSIPRVWGGAGKGEICDACAKVVTPEQFVMEGISTDDGKKGIQFHVKCFYLWTRCESYRPAKDVTADRNLLRRPDMTARRLKIPTDVFWPGFPGFDPDSEQLRRVEPGSLG